MQILETVFLVMILKIYERLRRMSLLFCVLRLIQLVVQMVYYSLFQNAFLIVMGTYGHLQTPTTNAPSHSGNLIILPDWSMATAIQ